MADSSDSGSVQSFQQVDANDGKDVNDNKRFYALYSISSKGLTGDEEKSTPESSDKVESNLSLTVRATNLSDNAESEVRKAIAHKLSKTPRNDGEGSFFSVGLSVSGQSSSSASCYFCVVNTSAQSLGFDMVSKTDKPEVTDQQQFIICFLSLQESALDSFRSELHQYIQGVSPLLDNESTTCPDQEVNASTIEATNVPPKVSAALQSYLEQWPSAVVGYLTRTLQWLKGDIQQLIYAALLNATVQVTGGSAQQEEDIKKFYQCCSFSTLLDQLQSKESSPGGDGDLWQVQPVVVTLAVTNGQKVEFEFDKQYSCQFCKNAAEKLVLLDINNLSKVRDFLESIKLAFSHNLNKLKRFLKQAEVDFYAQYRALSYLKKCGCGDLLLRYVKLDAGPDTTNVLSVLETFLKDMKQTLA